MAYAELPQPAAYPSLVPRDAELGRDAQGTSQDVGAGLSVTRRGWLP
jgi:hypothetical protein